MDKRYYVLILLGLGLLTRFMFFGYPDETVFDEVHFGKFVSGYYTHEYFFDIHPPLGKLAIAGFGKLFDFKPEFAFGQIGDKFPDKQYMILRFLPSLAGALLPLIIFLLLLEMGINKQASFLGGLFIVFENALLTQSHYILLDSFLLLFGFLSLLFYFRSRNHILHSTFYILLFGIFSGLSLSVKWTGIGFLGLPLVFEAWNILKNKNYKNIIKTLFVPVIIGLAVYFIFFAAHLIILNKSGTGDAFMSRGFQKTLIGNPANLRAEQSSYDGSQYANDPADIPNIFQKFMEFNAEMYKANQRLTATHPYSSPWYSGPFMTRTIYYWVNNNSRIYLIGNPLIWLLSTVAILFGISYYVLRIFGKNYPDKIYIFLLSGYVVNLLPFVGVKRVMFLYHYFTAYIFAIMILAWLLSQQKFSDNSRWLNSKTIFGTLLALGIIFFIYFAPLNYGLELSPNAYESRVWIESWR